MMKYKCSSQQRKTHQNPQIYLNEDLVFDVDINRVMN